MRNISFIRITVVFILFSEIIIGQITRRVLFLGNSYTSVNNLPQLISDVAFSCESLKVTTRLMHVIAWLLNQKAIRAGEIHPSDTLRELDELGYAPATDDWMVGRMPDEARLLITASEDLYYRVQRVSSNVYSANEDVPAPHRMIEKLRQAF